MTDIKKINIYMGVVGQAYVDKETAKKQMDAAAKNVVDVKHIIYLIDHSYADEFTILNDNDNYPLTMQSYEEIAQTTLNNATAASQLASTVKQNIQNALNGFSVEDQQYKELQALLNKLAENDIDGIYENGGNTILAEANVTRINAFITELAEIKSIAQNLLVENQTYYDECVVAYGNAKEIFESYVPESAEDQASKSNRLEAELIARLNNVATGLEIAQATTDAINQTSNDVMDEANEIIQSGGGEEPEPEVGYYWYVGTTKPTSLSEANVVDSYPTDRQLYINPSTTEKNYVYVLTNADKTVNFYDPAFPVQATNKNEDTTSIPGYTITRTWVKLAIGGEVLIEIL